MAKPSSVQSPRHSSRLQLLWICLGLVALAFILYLPVRSHGFINYDDPDYVAENFQIRHGLTGNSIVWAFTNTETANWHPLTWIFHISAWQAFGNWAGGHHLVSLIFHLLNILLLCAFLYRATAALTPSACVALFFALHPTHVESVAWASELKDVSSTFFLLCALLTYQQRFISPSPHPRWLMLTGLFFTLGLLCKPMVITLPLLLLILDYWPFQTWKHKPWSQLLKEKLPFVIIALIFSVITYLAQHQGGAVANIEALSLGDRLQNAILSYVAYLGKLAFPANLAVFYPYPSTISVGAVVIAVLFLAAISLAAWKLRQQAPWMLAGWLWFVVMLVPVIGIVQVGSQAYADRYLYAPSIGAFITVVWLVRMFSINSRLTQIGVASATVAISAACFILTHNYLKCWTNSVQLFEHALRVTKANFVAHNNLGMALVQAGDLEQSESHFRSALGIKANDPEAMNNLALLLLAKGQRQQAIDYFQQSLRLRPSYAVAHNNLANALALSGNMDSACEHYRSALSQKEHYPEAHNNLANVLALKGDNTNAILHYETAIKLDPAYAQARVNLAKILLRTGATDRAAYELSLAAALDPGNISAQVGLAEVLIKQSRWPEARSRLEAILNAAPNSPDAHLQMGILTAGHGTLDLAQSHFQQCLRFSPSNAEAYSELGILAGRQGDLPTAIDQLKIATSLEPRTARFRNNLGIALALHGQTNEARGEFESALKDSPGFAEAHYNLANVLLNQGARALAREHYQEAVRLRPDYQEAAAQLRTLSP